MEKPQLLGRGSPKNMLISSTKTLFPNKVTLTGTDRTSTRLFAASGVLGCWGGHNSTYKSGKPKQFGEGLGKFRKSSI